jgi:hypothetical protein
MSLALCPNRSVAAFLQTVNTNVTLPLTHWQLEVRMRWVKAVPVVPTNINELFEAHPLKTKLYSVGLLCSPRWALLWAWLFDREPGLRLLQLHIAQHKVNGLCLLLSVGPCLGSSAACSCNTRLPQLHIVQHQGSSMPHIVSST